MTDRAGFFAGLTDALSAMCVYYVVIGVLFMAGRGWGVHPMWLLLCAAACSVIFTLLLRKPRGVPLLTAVTAVLFAAVMAVFLLASETPARFGYVLALALGAGMAVGLPLRYSLHRPEILPHLTLLDGLILALLGLILCREAMDIPGSSVAIVVAVLLLDAAAAVGLRMSDGGGADSTRAFRASMAALGAACVVALLIVLLTAIFSRSGAVTGSILRGIGSVLSAVGSAIERFMLWLVTHLSTQRELDSLELAETAAIASGEFGAEMPRIPVNTTVIGVMLCLLLAAAAIAVAYQLRKKRLSAGGTAASVSRAYTVIRRGGVMGRMLERLLRALRFRWMAFLCRDTAGGVLVLLERRARRANMPRGAGESMRAFVGRVGGGDLDELADALDREYYGGQGGTLSPKQCRALRSAVRQTVRRAPQAGSVSRF